MCRAEENVLAYPTDPYLEEDILVHEFAHAMHVMGIRYVDTTFDEQLEYCYQSAKEWGLWHNTYAMSNSAEYWAEGVQCWFDLNNQAVPTDGVYNQINRRDELSSMTPNFTN